MFPLQWCADFSTQGLESISVFGIKPWWHLRIMPFLNPCILVNWKWYATRPPEVNLSSEGSKIMKCGPYKPPTFKNRGPFEGVFELQITLMLYLDFQRGIVPHNFHVCATFFKTAGMPQCHAIDPSLPIRTQYRF